MYLEELVWSNWPESALELILFLPYGEVDAREGWASSPFLELHNKK